MSFGNKTIVFRHLVPSGTTDDWGNDQPGETVVEAPHSRHRPLTFREATDLGFTVADQPWKTTIPLKDYSETLVEELVAAGRAVDRITVDDVSYKIQGGVRDFGDLNSRPFKMTIISTRWEA